MYWHTIQQALLVIQHVISFVGVLIILSGVIIALYQYSCFYFLNNKLSADSQINAIRLYFGRIIILGLEFIIAADLISTTTTPDYYAVGILAIIILIRTLLSFSLNREIMDLSKEQVAVVDAPK